MATFLGTGVQVYLKEMGEILLHQLSYLSSTHSINKMGDDLLLSAGTKMS